MHLFSPCFFFPEQQRRGKEVGDGGRNLGPLVPPPVPRLHAQFNPQILLKTRISKLMEGLGITGDYYRSRGVSVSPVHDGGPWERVTAGRRGDGPYEIVSERL